MLVRGCRIAELQNITFGVLKPVEWRERCCEQKCDMLSFGWLIRN
jgi:hypothetical protein